MPTGRIVTVIDKNNRRCQYFEFYLSGIKDPLYYKAFNTSSPYDITGPGGMIGDAANDQLRSASAERAIGASANVNSGGTYTFS